MALIAYLDETGDHTLELVDKAFPLFALVLLVCDRDYYINKVTPTVNQLKMDYFSHEAIILHSRDIRKAQGDFGFLTNPEKRKEFVERINKMMTELDYTLIATVIKKQEHKDKYTHAENPYDLALKFALERFLPMLEETKQTEITIIAEARGKNEDRDLELSFLHFVNYGTEYVDANRFKKIRFKLTFRPKSMNIVGTQLADLAAYPIARYILNPRQPNPAYNIVEKKFYRAKGRILGLKIFP